MRRRGSTALDLIEAVVIAVVLAMGIRFFLLEPFVIPTSSMEPTLLPGDRVLVNKLSYRLGEPQYGDIIVFRYPLDPRSIYIKRVIAHENQTVELRQGQLLIDGHVTREDFLPDTRSREPDFGPVKVPPGTYFVMGDNRNNSEDSRVWGTVPRRYILGEAKLLFWPPARIRVIQ